MKLSVFVWLFQTILEYDPPDQLEVIDGIVKLFNDIDINGDGDLQWAEFNQYIVDQVLSQNTIKDTMGNGTLWLTRTRRDRRHYRLALNFQSVLPES